MARVTLPEAEELTPTQRAQYERFPSNLTRGLLLMDDRLAGVLPELANALRASSLDPKLREAVILRVASLHNCAYERMQHLGQARKAGWTDNAIAQIEAGSNAVSELELGTLLRFVESVVAGVSMPDELFAETSRILSPRDLATVLVLVGHYMMVARFIATLDLPLDPAPDTWEHEH